MVCPARGVGENLFCNGADFTILSDRMDFKSTDGTRDKHLSNQNKQLMFKKRDLRVHEVHQEQP